MLAFYLNQSSDDSFAYTMEIDWIGHSTTPSKNYPTINNTLLLIIAIKKRNKLAQLEIVK